MQLNLTNQVNVLYFCKISLSDDFFFLENIDLDEKPTSRLNLDQCRNHLNI